MNDERPSYELNNLREHLKSEAEVRQFVQDAAILSVTAALDEAMEKLGVSRAEMARRLDRTPGFVSQVLSGERNMTLRTVADLAFALGLQLRNIELAPVGQMRVPYREMDSYLDQSSVQKTTASSSRGVYGRVGVAESIADVMRVAA